MTTKLFPFQLEGAAFLKSRKAALLADEMGIGKSAQSIYAARNLKKILVVCPATAKINWQREFIKFADRLSFVAGLTNKRDIKKQPRSNIVITNYENITNKIHRYREIAWDVVIFDEIQLAKEPTANRTTALFGSDGIIHYAKQVWCLSGTPAPNHVGELWVMMFTFGLTSLSYDGFVDRYCTTAHVKSVYAAKRITGTNTTHIHEVKTQLDKFSLRRKAVDVIKDMPPLSFNTVVVEATHDPIKGFPDALKAKIKEEWKILQRHLDMIEFSVDDDKLLNMLTMIAPSISSLRRYHGLKKAQVCAEIIAQELSDNAYKKIVIFAVHGDVIEIVKQKLKEFGVAVITGKVPQHKRQAEIDRFQNNPECRVFIGGIISAGTAITLTAANQVALIEPDYVPGNNQQAVKRVHRISQTLPVVSRFFSLPGFDERLADVLARKAREISTFIV